MTGILFDLDGTLLDTLDDLTNSVNATMDAFCCPKRSREDVRRFIGNGAYELIRLSVADGTDVDAALKVYQAHYKEHCEELTGPYAGIVEMLKCVSEKYPVAIVSNKPDAAAKKLCGRFFPGILAMGESEECPRKPAPDMLFRAMKAICADSCIYVGDSEVDVLTAENAGATCISVLWGFRDLPELQAAGGKLFCDRPDKLANMIESVASGDIYGK